MSTFRKLLSGALFLGISMNPAFAAPFDILGKYLPDIAVTDIRLDTGNIYVKVCNVGGALPDNAKPLVVAVQKLSGGATSRSVSTNFLGNTGCYEFLAASASDLGLSSGAYNVTAGAYVEGLVEKDKTNNRLTKSVNLGSSYTSHTQTPTTSYSYYDANTINNTNTTCNQSNNYCSNQCDRYGNCGYYYGYTNQSSVYYHNICPPGVYCPDNEERSYYNSNGTLCNSNNNYCGNGYYNYDGNTYNSNGTNYDNSKYNYCNYNTCNGNESNYQNYYYNNGTCTNCSGYYNNSYYNGSIGATRITYPNGGEQLSNNSGVQFSVSANIAYNPQAIDHIDVNIYRRGRYSGSYDELYKTDRSSPPYVSSLGSGFGISRTFSTAGWASGDYSARVLVYDRYNNVLAQDDSDGVFHVGSGGSSDYDRPDFYIGNIYQNASDGRIMAQVCNRGRDMYSSAYIRTDFVGNNTVASTFNNLQLLHDQCVDSAVSVDRAALNLIYNSSYRINATVDVSNAIIETDESNNSFAQYLQIQ